MTLSPLQRFWRLLKPDQQEIRNVYIYAIFNGLIALSLPLGIQAIVNQIQGGQINSSWIILVTFVVLGVAFSGILQILQLRVTENLQQVILGRAAFEFSFRIPRIKMETLYKYYAPELMNRFFDIMTVQKGLSKVLIDFSSASLQVVFGLILLSLYHPFFIAFSIILIILVYSIFRFTASRGLVTSLAESKYKYQLAHWLQEIARNNNTFRLAGESELHLEKTDQLIKNYVTARESHFSVLVKQYSLLTVFKVLVATGLLAIGGILVMEQLMNIGQFIAAEIIILLIMSSVEKLVLSLETIYDVLTALEKIGQVTDLELEKSGQMDIKNEVTKKGISVEIDHVNFKYPNNNKETLKDLTLSINEGDKVAITGANGSGKSSLLKVILGLYDVSSGSIAYNGYPIGNIDVRSLRSITGDAMSYEQLFEGSVLENITLGRKDVSMENVRWAVEALGLAEFIKSLPEGYNTMIESPGNKISNSDLKKLLLARSIVDKPKLLIIEDTLEDIDVLHRNKIIDFLTSTENEWSFITISSDPYLLQKVNRIILMQDGSVLKEGGFKELTDDLNMLSHA